MFYIYELKLDKELTEERKKPKISATFLATNLLAYDINFCLCWNIQERGDRRRHDTRHNDTQRTNIQHYDAQHYNTQHYDSHHNNNQHYDPQHYGTHHNDIQHYDAQHDDAQHYNAQHNNKTMRHSA
jgi:hypothetical protein